MFLALAPIIRVALHKTVAGAAPRTHFMWPLYRLTLGDVGNMMSVPRVLLLFRFEVPVNDAQAMEVVQS